MIKEGQKGKRTKRKEKRSTHGLVQRVILPFTFFNIRTGITIAVNTNHKVIYKVAII